jgi:membrane protease YdiL (CAAX protease family)
MTPTHPAATRTLGIGAPWSGARWIGTHWSGIPRIGTPGIGARWSGARWSGAALTRPARSVAPRRGSLADPETGRPGLSTAPGPGGGERLPDWGPVPAWVVVVGGLAFLLGRPGLQGMTFGVPLLVAGYLALGGAALVVRERHAAGPAGAPLGWGVTLGIGVAAVLAAGVVAGPFPDRRVGFAAGAITVMAGVAEEALFRRVLYDRLLRFGVVVAVGGTAVVFALVHLPAYGVAAMPVDLGAALLLSWQRYASSRWTVPAVTHAVANLLAVT